MSKESMKLVIKRAKMVKERTGTFTDKRFHFTHTHTACDCHVFEKVSATRYSKLNQYIDLDRHGISVPRVACLVGFIAAEVPPQICQVLEASTVGCRHAPRSWQRDFGAVQHHSFLKLFLCCIYGACGCWPRFNDLLP